MDSMCPAHHIFVMRNLIEIKNHYKNSYAVKQVQKKTGMNVCIDDQTGRLFTTSGNKTQLTYFDCVNYIGQEQTCISTVPSVTLSSHNSSTDAHESGNPQLNAYSAQVPNTSCQCQH